MIFFCIKYNKLLLHFTLQGSPPVTPLAPMESSKRPSSPCTREPSPKPSTSSSVPSLTDLPGHLHRNLLWHLHRHLGALLLGHLVGGEGIMEVFCMLLITWWHACCGTWTGT